MSPAQLINPRYDGRRVYDIIKARVAPKDRTGGLAPTRAGTVRKGSPEGAGRCGDPEKTPRAGYRILSERHTTYDHK